MGRRDNKETDVYQPPSPATTLSESGRRIPLRHSDAPDYETVSVLETRSPRRRGLWLLVALLVLVALALAAWRFLAT